MIIIHRPYSVEKNGPLKRMYSVFESNENILIKYELLDSKQTGEVLLSKQDYTGKCVDVWSTLDSSYQTKVIVRDILLQDPLERIEFKQYNKICRVVFDEDQIYCHLQGNIKDISGFENYIIQDGEFSSTVLLELSDLFKSIKKQYQAKTKLLHNVSTPNSLAYLECQLDLLTRVIIQNKDLFKQTLELSLLEEYDQQSVLLFKDNILDELKNKLNVRQQQAEYILTR